MMVNNSKIRLLTFLVVQVACLRNSQAIYLPEYHGPEKFCSEKLAVEKKGTDDACKSTINTFVNKLDSVENIMPYDYDRFDFCRVDEKSSPSENLGQVVFGDRIRPSPYKFTFNKNESCQKVCTKKYNVDKKDGDEKDKAKLRFLKKAVLFNYQHHWIIDNMPVVWCYEVQTYSDDYDRSTYCSPYFPVGCFVDVEGNRKDACVIDQRYGGKNSYYIFNHVNIDIEYHPIMKDGDAEDDNIARLVRARIVPFSIKQTMKGDEIGSCNPSAQGYGNGLSIPGGSQDAGDVKEISITYSYNVSFTKTLSVNWASRWDYLLDQMNHLKINWFSITNSLVVVVFLTGVIASILWRVFKEEYRTKAEHRTWMFLDGDVFRPPRNEMLLSVFLGNGSQIVIVTFFTLCLAAPGIISPVNRGSLGTTILILFSCTGIITGYVSTKVYKSLDGQNVQANVLLNSFLIPGVVFSQFFCNNLIFWGYGSSAAVPFSTLVILLGLWFVVYVPLVFIGSYVAFKQKSFEAPCAIGEIPRSIPKRIFFTSLIPCVGGILPFGCIFIQLFFILNSIWSHQYYYIYGILIVVALLMVVTLAECAIVLCYLQLKFEDYRWWWRSFLAGGSTAFYVFLYCISYYCSHLEIHGAASKFVYFSYSFVMAFLLFLFCGTVSFFSCLLFVLKMYSTIETI